MQIPVLHTQRLTLRAPAQQDFDTFADFFMSERAKFVGGPATREQSWRMLATELGHWPLRGYGRWSVTETATDAFVGTVGPWNPEGWPEPEIGWDLMNGHEGKGYATEAARAALDYVYGTLGWTTAISLVAPANDGSRNVARRLGARHDGMFEHERHGTLEIWRHLSPEDLRAGSGQGDA